MFDNSIHTDPSGHRQTQQFLASAFLRFNSFHQQYTTNHHYQVHQSITTAISQKPFKEYNSHSYDDIQNMPHQIIKISLPVVTRKPTAQNISTLSITAFSNQSSDRNSKVSSENNILQEQPEPKRFFSIKDSKNNLGSLSMYNEQGQINLYSRNQPADNQNETNERSCLCINFSKLFT